MKYPLVTINGYSLRVWHVLAFEALLFVLLFDPEFDPERS